ncbi:MAG: tetratricopeptide repeat protein [Myxococcales bacterium]|nr:tetratricopeptide repeat protein [Myxococcales bacterium]
MAPSPAKTDVVLVQAHPDEVSEITRNFEAPDAGALVERMLELVSSEAEALLAGDDDGRLADLNVRTALASWDALHQPDEAMRFLELADRHPLAHRLRLAAALVSGQPDALAAAEQRIGDDPGALAIELAEAWLWRHGRADRTAAIADRLLASSLSAPWRAHVIELAALAHAALGNWARVVELRRGALTASSSPEEVAATAALLLDRTGDAAAALITCWAKLEHYPGVGNLERTELGWLRTFDLAIAAATILDDERRYEILDKRAELVASLAGGAIEALATRHAIGAELERDREHKQALALWLQLAQDPSAQLPGVASRIAYLRAAWSAAGAVDRVAALAAHRRLAGDPSSLQVAATHAWRALELASATSDPTVGELARAVVDTVDSAVAERWLDAIELAAPNAATMVRFEERGGLFLRWAAAIAERRGEPANAIKLWARAATETTLPTTNDHVVRLHRGGDEDQLAEAYTGSAKAETDERSAAALWCARGIVDLARGDFVEAEESLRHAADLGPKDPFCRAALAAVYRAGKHYEQLSKVLSELASSLTSKDARAQAAREHAELLDEHLGDPAGARAALERLVAERPDDGNAMLTLAKLYDRDELSPRAIELRTKAVELAPTPARKGEIWLEIAAGEERRGNEAAALAALDHAVATKHPDALREQARLHRQAGRLDQALAIVRAELATDPPLERRMQLQTELARTLTELGQEPEAVVAAYLDVLSGEPDQTEALIGIEEPARALGLWDELARAFRGAPQTPRNVEVLAEALAKIAEWSELSEVRRKQLEAATLPAEKAQRAAELAKLYELELGDTDGAIRMLLIAQTAQPEEARQQDLLRLLRAAQRWAEVAVVLERELPTIKPGDVERQVAVLLELGELRATRLSRQPDAVGAYEGVLALRPDDPTAAKALEGLYEQTGRDRELARILETRAEATQDAPARAQLFGRVATLRSNRGDVDGALAAYTAAFAADPTNREVFTAMERVCYKAERWAAAMQLYESAIAHVENGVSRAYRLGDLYSRRGNVQLNFLGQVEAAIESYQKVIEVDSQPAAAVKILETLCSQRGNWQALIDAYEKRAETQRDPARRTEALRSAAQLSSEHASDARHSMRLQRKLLAVDPADAGAAHTLERYYEDAQDKSGLIDILKMRLSQTTGKAESVELLKRIARVSEEGARDVDTATEHYLKILEIQPENRDALDALGRIYESTEQWAEFIEVTRKLIKVTNDRNTKALLYFRCGSVMEAKFGREQDAIRYYDAAIKTSSACLPAVHGLRDLYRRREEWPRVIETLELEVKLWQDDKERAGVFAQIGRIFDKQLGDAEKAMHFYESALSVDPDCLPANQALFEHFFDAGEWEKAQPLATALAQKAMRDGDPSTRSDFYRRRGVVARMTGDPRAAAESFIVALELKPTNAEALDELGALARERPEAWEFDLTYRELDKLYRRRDDAHALLARVHIGRASIIERDGDLDQAAELYREAVELAPSDFTVLSALVEFHADVRHWAEAITAIQKFVNTNSTSPEDRLRARMRQASIHADGEMDPHRSIGVLRDVIKSEPAHQDAYYMLAQQYFLIAKYTDARQAIDRVIELATAPGQPLSASDLARYYYYKGRILDSSGDVRAAAPQYRRATEYDPGYAPPALVLARRAADGGDQRQAESILIEAAHAAMAQGGPRAAVPLQRGLARILLASGDRPAAIEAYRGILNVEPDSPSDRVALAEIYAVDDPKRAIGELRKVLERDIHHAPAYRLLASFYNRTGDVERANRVLTALDLLGFAEEADRSTAQRLRATRVAEAMRRPISDDQRERYLITQAAREPLGEVFAVFAEELSSLVAQPSLGENLLPAQGTEPRLVQLAAELGFLYEIDAEVFVGEKVPGLFAVTAYPRRLVVIDRSLLAESDLALRFMFGYAFEAIRGGYAALLQLGARHRRELGALLRALLASDAELTGPAAELVNTANTEAQKVLEAHAGIRDVDAGAWMDGMLACAKRAGLLACDDFAAAIWAVARLSGERLPSHDATVALGSVLGGPDLVRFYLSDDYQQLRDALTVG